MSEEMNAAPFAGAPWDADADQTVRPYVAPAASHGAQEGGRDATTPEAAAAKTGDEPSAPKPAPKPEEPSAPPMKGKVVTTITHCLRASWAESPCRHCMDICPTGAISYDSRIVISSKKCIECALCANACPTDGILASMTPPESLYNRIVGKIEEAGASVFYLTCSQTDVDRASGCVFTVPCLGDISPELWYALVREYDVRAYLPDGLCLDCPASTGADLMFDCVEAAQGWLGFDIPLEGTWRTLSIPENGYRDDSGLFTNLVQRIGEASKGHDTVAIRAEAARQERLMNLGTALVSRDSVENRKPLEERGKRLIVTGRRRLLLNVLGHHPEYCDEVKVRISKTTESCIACRDCIEACPVGARIATPTEGGTAIKTDARHCIGCGQCLTRCEHGGLKWVRTSGNKLVAGLADFAAAAEAEREEQRRLREERRKNADRRRAEAIERSKQERAAEDAALAERRAAPSEQASITPPAYEPGGAPTHEPAAGDE